MNIYQKLIEVRKTVPYLQKEAKGFQYNYVSSSQVLSAVRAKMDEVGLMLVPRVVSHQVTREGDEKKSTYFTELEIEFEWINAENPEERIVCSWYGQGIDIAGEKGVGKALTYAEKYFLLKTFNIATDNDDPDSFQEKPKQESKTHQKQDEKERKPIGSDQKAANTKKSDKVTKLNLANFWTSVKNLKMSEDDVHKEAAAYFNIPDLKSLNDIPGLTATQIGKFLLHLRELVNS